MLGRLVLWCRHSPSPSETRALAGWFAVAPPLRRLPSPTWSPADPRPKLLVVPEHDQFRPPGARPRIERMDQHRARDDPGGDHYWGAGPIADGPTLLARAA